MSGTGGKSRFGGEDDLLVNALLDILSEDAASSELSEEQKIQRNVTLSTESARGVSELDSALGTTSNDLSHTNRRSLEYGAESKQLSDSGFSILSYNKAAGENEVHCRSCGALSLRSNKYCGYCAAYLGDQGVAKQYAEIALSPISEGISMVAINEDSSDGVLIPLTHNVTVLGRSGDKRFPSDPFLSPSHARLIVDAEGLWLEDLGSLNGTYVRIRDEVCLSPGDCFLAGRQILRFERFEQLVSTKSRSADGTRYMGSPPSGGDFKLVQVGIGGVSQNTYCLSEGGAVIGREKGDIVFSKDRFMSGRHGQIYLKEDGRYYLLDLNSSNGTWLMINQRIKLKHEDLIFLGQQLFRVEMSGYSA